MALEIVRRFVNGAWKTEAAEAGGGGSVPPVTLTGTAPGPVLTLVSGDPVVGASSNLVLKDNAGNIVATIDNDGGGELANGHILIAQHGAFTVDIDVSEAAGNAVYELKKGGQQIFAVRPGGGISSLLAAYVPGDVAVAVVAATGQTANILEVYDENFVLVFAITPSGGIAAPGLPTSNPGPGLLWNNAGTVKVGT